MINVTATGTTGTGAVIIGGHNQIFNSSFSSDSNNAVTSIGNNTTFRDSNFTSNSGIGFSQGIGSDNNFFIGNTFVSDGDSAYRTLSGNNTFSNNTFRNNIKTSIDLNAGNNTFNFTVIISNSTWINASDGANMTNTLFETANGSIRIIGEAVLTDNSNASPHNLNISFNRSFLNSSNLTFFNISSQIVLNNITINNPIPIVDTDLDETFTVCPLSDCTIVSFTDNQFIMNVTSFSTHATVDGPNISQVILNTTSVNNLTSDNLTAFFINVTHGLNNSAVKNITDWRVNNSTTQESIAIVNMPFEGRSNSTFTQDYSTNNLHADVVDAVFNSTGGYDGFGAYEFDGVDDYVNLTAQPNLTQGFTFSAWVKRKSDNSSQATQEVFNNNQFFLRTRPENEDEGNAFEAFVLLDDASVEPRAGSGVPSIPGSWFFVTVTWNMSDLQIYVNGSLEGTSSRTGNLTPTTASPQIGRGQQTTDATNDWNGTIDDVMFFDRVLSASQIALLFDNRTDIIHNNETSNGENWTVCVTPTDSTNNGTEVCSNSVLFADAAPTIDQVILNATSVNNFTSDNLTAFFIGVSGSDVKNITDWRLNNVTSQESIAFVNLPFEGGSTSTSTEDYSTHSNDATVENATFNSTGGFDGFGAYEFVDSNDLINISPAQVPNESGSIEFWMNVNDTSPTQVAIYQGVTGGNGFGGEAELHLGVGTNVFIFHIEDTNLDQDCALQTVPVSANQWFHVVGTYANLSTNMTCALYINGTLAAEETPNGGVHDSSTWTQLLIGKTGSAIRDFNGTIDEVRIWNRTLSAGQIALLYNNRTDIIHSNETDIGDNWTICATPTDTINGGSEVCSNSVTIENNAPTIDQVILNSTSGTNQTSDNLTAFFINVTDLDGDNVKNITDWRVNNSTSQESIAVVNYPFEAGSNVSFTKDYSTHGNNGTPENATFSSTSGYDGFGAYEFNGTSYIRTGLTTVLQNFSVGAWVFPEGNSRTRMTIVDKASFFATAATDFPFALYTDPTGRNYTCHVDSGNDFVADLEVTTGFFSNNSWHHVFCTYDGNNLNIYVDGVLNASDTGSVTLASNTRNYTIGRSAFENDGGGDESGFTGRIDEVMIMNRTLSANQIALLANNRTDILHNNETSSGDNWTICATPTDGTSSGSEVCSNGIITQNAVPSIDQVILNATSTDNSTNDNLTAFFINVIDANNMDVKNVTDWRVNNSSTQESIAVVNYPFEAESTASFTRDHSTHGNNGTVENATFSSTAGYDGFGTYEFNSTGYIRTGLTTILQNFSIGAWVFPEDTTRSRMTIVDKASFFATAATDFPFAFYVLSNGSYVCHVDSGNDFVPDLEVTAETFVNNTWRHVFCTYDGNNLNIYVDGALNATNTGSVTLSSNTRNYTIGRSAFENSGGLNQSGFTGMIDEVMIFNRTLSSGQIALLADNRTDIIHANETIAQENWTVCVTPTDTVDDGSEVCSNSVTIAEAPPSIDQVILNATTSDNSTNDDLFANVVGLSPDGAISTFEWYKDGVLQDHHTNTTLSTQTQTDEVWFVNATPKTYDDNPFDISTATFTQNVSTNPPENNPRGVVFNNDGSKMYVVGIGADNVTEYNLSVPYDVTTATFTTSFRVFNEATGANGVAFNNDGTKMYIIDLGDDEVYEYNLSVGFDVSTASFTEQFDIGTEFATPLGITFNNDGTKMYVTGFDGSNVTEYNLSTPFLVTSASLASGFSDSFNVPSPTDVAFNNDGSKMYILGGSRLNVSEYNLSVPFAVSSATYTQNFSLTGIVNAPHGLTLNNDGSKLYVVGFTNDGVQEFNITDVTVGDTVMSNNLTIANNAPNISQVILNATSTDNLSTDNLTAFFINVTDSEGDNVKNITDWRVNNSTSQESIAVVNMPFEAGSTSTFTRDYSTHGNDGTVSSATFTESGGFDGFGAYEFDGADDNIVISDNVGLNPTQELSIETWIYPMTTDNAFDVHIYLSKDDALSTRDWQLGVNTSNNVRALFWNHSDTITTAVSDTISLFNWTHVVVTVKADDAIKIYINGELNGSTPFAGNLTSGTDDIVIGDLGDFNFPWNGSIDEVRIYNRTLSAGQIALLHDNRTDIIHSDETTNSENWTVCATPSDGNSLGSEVCSNGVIISAAVPNISQVILNATSADNSTTDNLTAFYINVTNPTNDDVQNITDWRVNETSIAVAHFAFSGGTTSSFARDYSSQQQNITVGNVVFNSTEGHDGFGGIVFSGANDEVMNISSPTGLPAGGANRSIEVWIKPNNIDPGGNLIHYGDGSGGGQEFILQLITSGGNTFLFTDGVNGDNNIVISGNQLPVAGVWNHIIFTVDSDGDWNYYKNGSLMVNDTFNTTIDTSTPAILNIGDRTDFSSPNFDGTIGLVRIYNRTLSPNQTALLFANETSVLHSDETQTDDNWTVYVTPNDATQEGETVISNNLTIANSAPNISQVILNATSTENTSTDNLTAFFINVTDNDGDNVKNITDWRVNNSTSQESFALMNMPFEAESSSGSGSTNGTTKDYSTRNSNGTVINATFSSTGGYDGFGGYEFNAFSIITQEVGALERLGAFSDNYSIGFWFKTENDGVIVSKNEHDNTGLMPFYIDVLSGSVRFAVRDDDEIFRVVSSTTNNFDNDTWHFIVAMRHGTNLTIFSNGVFDNSATNSGITADMNNTQPLLIGAVRDVSADGFTGFFNGSIDEVRIWNRTLSTNQISLLYNNRTDIIHNNETLNGQNWTICATPTDGNSLGSEVCSNNLTIAGEPDLRPFNISYSVDLPKENETITINATVLNNGTTSASDITVQFYDGNCSAQTGNLIDSNRTISSLGAGSTEVVNVSYNASPVGPHNITVCVDPSDLISESNETNNVARRELNVLSFVTFFGPTVGNITLETTANRTLYSWGANDAGNVLFADSDVLINFENLQALGLDSSGSTSSNDFSEADIVLNMTGFNDSIQNQWGATASTPKQTANFTVFGKNITNVPIINSSNNTNFLTGILWDTTADSDGEFDSSENETLVFISNINRSQIGFNGTVDFEANVPSLLRSWNETTTNISFFLELR